MHRYTVSFITHIKITSHKTNSGVTTMGSDRANPGALNPNEPIGGPQTQAVEQKHWPGRPLICYNVVL
jgi:hypothetical protein